MIVFFIPKYDLGFDAIVIFFYLCAVMLIAMLAGVELITFSQAKRQRQQEGLEI